VQNDAFTRVNARIGAEKDNLSIEFYVTNLFDNRDWDFIFRNVYQGSAGAIFQPLPSGFGFPAFGFPQGIVVGVPDKRDMGLRVAYKF
jgi:outer membrane receptor protein involved in Fe transport